MEDIHFADTDSSTFGLTSPEVTVQDECSFDDHLLFQFNDPLFLPPSEFSALEFNTKSKQTFADTFISLEDKNKEQRRKEKQRAAVKRHRKRKNEEMQRLREEAKKLSVEKAELERKLKLSSYITKRKKPFPKCSESMNQNILLLEMDKAESLLRRRKEILQRILEAWNLGGIDDMQDIAEEVYDKEATLISPDYSDELRGINAIMSHWNELIDAFPDGIMEEYNIREEDPEGEKMRLSWIFSGTQVKEFIGIPPRHMRLSIKGNSFVTFNGSRIHDMVITWNYREALLKMMGVENDNFREALHSASKNSSLSIG